LYPLKIAVKYLESPVLGVTSALSYRLIMQTSYKVARGLGERTCLVAWMFLMVANTVLVGLSVELLVFGLILSFDQVNLIDNRTIPFLGLGFLAALNFPIVIKLHSLGVAHLNFEIHENLLNNASESWQNMILTLLDEKAPKSHQIDGMIRAISNAASAAERQERRMEAKAWLMEHYQGLSDDDKEAVDENMGYLKIT
jgi:hypothetical protein